MTRLLVEGGADLEAVDVNGNGVVHAAVCDSPAVLAILIDHGADVAVSNYDGLTPKVRPACVFGVRGVCVAVCCCAVLFPAAASASPGCRLAATGSQRATRR